LLNPSGYTFTQPSFTTSAPNLYQEASSVYTLASSSDSESAGLVFKSGGNLVNTAIKWTNGKSLGNFYRINRHSSTFTGGFVGVENNILKVKCGETTSLLNRGLLHDVKFQRNGNEITEASNTVIGYMYVTDTVNCSLDFTGYVEPFDFNQTFVPSGLFYGNHTQFWVGFRYLHTQNGWLGSGLPAFLGSGNGFGFIGVRNSNTSMTWWAVIVADDNLLNEEGTQFAYQVNTNASVFSSVNLRVTFNNGNISFFVNESQVGTTQSIGDLTGNDWVFNTGGNPLYAGIASLKGGGTSTIPGVYTICVDRCAVWRNLAHMQLYNNFEDTDTEVTATDSDYQTTGLHLLKKLK
jgi:hypothetical protein